MRVSRNSKFTVVVKGYRDHIDCFHAQFLFKFPRVLQLSVLFLNLHMMVLAILFNKLMMAASRPRKRISM